jgi:hypothetical protein
MIRKCFLTAIVLFITYSVFIVYVAPSWWRSSQNQWQTNIIKAQHFIYSSPKSYDHIIVGSSLSNRILTDSLRKTYNLSFAGQSIFDGLAILIKKDDMPRDVFIEMNVVFRRESDDFLSSLHAPLLQYSRKWMPVLREENQPLGILGKVVYKHSKPVINFFNHYTDRKKDEEFFSRMLNVQDEAYSALPEQKQLTECFEALKRYVSILEDKHVNVIFFEMPVDRHLQELPRAKIIRQKFNEYFSDKTYRYVPFTYHENIETTDGVHLSNNEALRYTLFLRTYINGLD